MTQIEKFSLVSIRTKASNFSIFLHVLFYFLQDTKLKAQTIATSVYARSVRNCPWCAQLWLGYARVLERNGQNHDKIKGIQYLLLKICCYTFNLTSPNM